MNTQIESIPSIKISWTTPHNTTRTKVFHKRKSAITWYLELLRQDKFSELLDKHPHGDCSGNITNKQWKLYDAACKEVQKQSHQYVEEIRADIEKTINSKLPE